MARIPDVSTFNMFSELDPQQQNRCIYITQSGARCKWNCSDNSEAIKLHATIIKCLGKDIELDLLRKYILSNCCTSGRAKHRDRIEDVGLLTPLAYRWQSEIRRQTKDLFEILPAAPATHIHISKALLSEFRPHIAKPTLTDSVSKKLQGTLVGRDLETGSLYIFDRVSSPGHVKIGWTAKSVETRLESWSKCGYDPNLLFSVKDVPFAQRVETLTHYELIREWRRERMCKAEWCRKSHSEWFETSPKRATQVLSDWVAFIETARPYELQNQWSLKPCWKEIVEKMNKKEEPITGRSLLERHQAHELKKQVFVKISVDARYEIKSEDQEIVQFEAKKQEQGIPKHSRTHIYSIPIPKHRLSQETSLLVNQSLPQPISPFKIRLQAALKRTKSDSSLKIESCPRTDLKPVLNLPKYIETEPSLVRTFIKDELLIKVEDID